jgi:sugar transferase (PEP-CTERM/EpsH1 system associated)
MDLKKIHWGIFMRILFVTPYPPSRIRVRGYELLRQLKRQHEVTIITQSASQQELADVEHLRTQGYEVVVVHESKRESMQHTALALFSAEPLQVAYARSQRFADAVQLLYTQHGFDVVHVEHLRGIASIERLARTLPLVWDAVDCISLLSKHTMMSGPGLVIRMVARLEYPRTQSYEANILNHCQRVVVTSTRDRQAMIELLRKHNGDATNSDDELGATIEVIPNGVDLDYFQPLEQERHRYNLVFSGKMSYHANVATALYLYHHIMPLIWRQRPEVTLTIVGSKPPTAIQCLARDARVKVTGYVDDMRSYVGRAEVMLSPMVYSVGIQNKVLEAMALGTPVVVDAQAASSLNAQSGRDLLVASTPQEFAAATLRLLDDAELRAAMGRSGRAYVEAHHNWHEMAQRISAVYQQVSASYDRNALPSIPASPVASLL